MTFVENDENHEIHFVLFSTGLPQAENFSFTFHTLMSDAALKCDDFREQVN
jgi:hypothetical protein